jgi:hypothetical protein
MQIGSYLATADGRWIASESRELLDILGDPNPNFDPVGFAVRNLGFVQYDTLGDTFAQVTLFPKRVAPLALATVQDRIHSRTGCIFRIDHLDTGTKCWTQYLAMNSMEAIGRLNDLCGTYVAAQSDEQYGLEPKDLGLIVTDETHPAHPLVRKWRSSFNRFDETVLSFMMKNGLAAMGMIIGVDPKKPEPTFRFIGNGFWGFENEFFLRGVGEKVENQPDKQYGQWVSPFYTEVATTWRPRYDKCVANIDRSNRGRRYHYERLILPWSTGSGEVFVTLSSRFIKIEGEAPSDVSSSARSLAKKAAKSS